MEAVDEEAEEERGLRREPIVGSKARAREELEDRGDATDARVDPGRSDARREPSAHPLTEPLELRIPGWRQVPLRREAGRRRDRVAVECPAVDEGAGPSGIELAHDVGATAEAARRVAAADDLAERAQVRAHAPEASLGAVRADAEADHLIEDQQRPD